MTTPVPTPPAPAVEAPDLEHWGYRAIQPIDIGGARAFNTDDLVPNEHVTGKVVPADAVAKINTKAAAAAAKEQ